MMVIGMMSWINTTDTRRRSSLGIHDLWANFRGDGHECRHTHRQIEVSTTLQSICCVLCHWPAEEEEGGTPENAGHNEMTDWSWCTEMSRRGLTLFSLRWGEEMIISRLASAAADSALKEERIPQERRWEGRIHSLAGNWFLADDCCSYVILSFGSCMIMQSDGSSFLVPLGFCCESHNQSWIIHHFRITVRDDSLFVRRERERRSFLRFLTFLQKRQRVYKSLFFF